MLAVDPSPCKPEKGLVFVGGDLKGSDSWQSHERRVGCRRVDRALFERPRYTGGTKNRFESQDIPLRRYYLDEPEVLWIPPEKRMHFQLFEKGFT